MQDEEVSLKEDDNTASVNVAAREAMNTLNSKVSEVLPELVDVYATATFSHCPNSLQARTT